MVPFNDLKRQYQGVEREILAATRRVYESGNYILGEEVAALEREFSRYCGVRYGVGVGSGTEALSLSLKAVGIGDGDEVITPANSFVATALAISFTGATPVFVDIDHRTYNMDPNALELLLKRRMAKAGWEKVKAVLPVHLYGHPAEMNAILEIANQYGLRVIEDACQAHGATLQGKKVGSFGTLGCFSFYPTKNLGGYGDGGMIVTNQLRLYEKLRLLRCYGEKRKYEHAVKGGNSRLDEIQAALLRVKLRRLDQWNEERRHWAKRYTERLAPLGVLCPFEKKGVRHVYHLYVIRTVKRDSLQSFLKKRGVHTLIHYPIPIHQQKAFKDLGYRRGDFPLTERSSRKILSLPFFPGIKVSEMEEVVREVQQFLSTEALPTRSLAGPGRSVARYSRNQTRNLKFETRSKFE